MKSELNDVLLIVLKTTSPGFGDHWSVEETPDGHLHLFANMTTGLDLLSLLGSFAVEFSLGYSLDEHDEPVINERDFIEIDISNIPERIMAFKGFGPPRYHLPKSPNKKGWFTRKL